MGVVCACGHERVPLFGDLGVACGPLPDLTDAPPPVGHCWHVECVAVRRTPPPSPPLTPAPPPTRSQPSPGMYWTIGGGGATMAALNEQTAGVTYGPPCLCLCISLDCIPRPPPITPPGIVAFRIKIGRMFARRTPSALPLY